MPFEVIATRYIPPITHTEESRGREMGISNNLFLERKEEERFTAGPVYREVSHPELLRRGIRHEVGQEVDEDFVTVRVTPPEPLGDQQDFIANLSNGACVRRGLYKKTAPEATYYFLNRIIGSAPMSSGIPEEEVYETSVTYGWIELVPPSENAALPSSAVPAEKKPVTV